jgi:hypothetical protein
VYNAHAGSGPVEDDICRRFDDSIAVAVGNGAGPATIVAEGARNCVLARVRVTPADIWEC